MVLIGVVLADIICLFGWLILIVLSIRLFFRASLFIIGTSRMICTLFLGFMMRMKRKGHSENRSFLTQLLLWAGIRICFVEEVLYQS